MKAVTIRDKWAPLIVFGGKDVENRPRVTRHRGPVLIHQGLTPWLRPWGQTALRAWERAQADPEFKRLADAMRKLEPHSRYGDFAGYVIGVVRIVECRIPRPGEILPSAWAQPECVHWILKDPAPLRYPVPATGRLFLFDVPDDVVRPALPEGYL